MSETERITLVGNLTADPELRYTPSGLQVTSLRLAVTPHPARRRHLDRRGDQLPHRQRLARPGQHATESLTKGARVLVVGRPKQRTWTDSDGTEHQVTEVDAEGSARRCAGPPPGHPRQRCEEGERPVQRPAAVLTARARERGANPAGQAGRAPSPNTPGGGIPVLHHPDR